MKVLSSTIIGILLCVGLLSYAKTVPQPTFSYCVFLDNNSYDPGTQQTKAALEQTDEGLEKFENNTGIKFIKRHVHWYNKPLQDEFEQQSYELDSQCNVSKISILITNSHYYKDNNLKGQSYIEIVPNNERFLLRTFHSVDDKDQKDRSGNFILEQIVQHELIHTFGYYNVHDEQNEASIMYPYIFHSHGEWTNTIINTVQKTARATNPK